VTQTIPEIDADGKPIFEEDANGKEIQKVKANPAMKAFNEEWEKLMKEEQEI